MSAEWRAPRSILAIALLLVLAGGLAALARRARLERADFVFDNGSEVATLDPATVSTQADGRIVSALFEGLVTRDPETLEPRPGAATAWERSPDGLSWVFHLREARWSNGDPLGSADFLWSWRRLLEPETAAPYGYLLWCVRGAEAFARSAPGEREARWGEVGLEAPDARTLVVHLARPTAYFLELAGFHPLFPVHRRSLEQARAQHPSRWQTEWIRPGRLVSNGAYRLRDRRVNDRVRLTKNTYYWDADSIAFRTIDALAIDHVATGLNLYLAGEVDWIDRVPTQLVPRLRTREDFEPAPYLASYFYRVNTTRPPLDDVRVRRALALSIDRRALCERITQKGERPSWSLTSEGLAGYPRPEMAHAPVGSGREDYEAALAADRAEARALLASAGFGGGQAPPPIEIHFNTSETHRDIAEVIAADWSRVLGIDVRFRNQEQKSWIEAQRNLQYDLSRSSWIGDYADPSTFLEAFLGDSPNNRTGWRDPRYDGLLAEAAREVDARRRMQLLARAEALLLEELPILPIYGYVSQNLVNPRLGGFHANVLDEHPAKAWYWKSDEELAAERAARSDGRARVPAPGPPRGLRAGAARERGEEPR